MSIKYKVGKGIGKKVTGMMGYHLLELENEHKTFTINKLAKILKEHYKLNNMNAQLELHSIKFTISKEYKEEE